MRPRLSPLPFFIGLGAGLIALSWLGAAVESPRLIRTFLRFHQLISPEAGYLPSARQVRSLIEARTEGAPPVFVIIGGTSVLYGSGQHESLIWTKHLQQELGSRFRVINLAQRGGGPNDFGNIAAEFLLQQSRRVIYVADGVTVLFAPPLERSSYQYIIFDAWQRGYLLPWPPRDQLLSDAAWRGPKELRASAWGALLNNYLNFNDLWNHVAYEYANSNWNKLLATRSFQPRFAFADNEPTPDQQASLRYRQNRDQAMRLLRNQILQSRRTGEETAAQLTAQMMPPRLRAVTLAVLRRAGPYYVDELEPDERAAYSDHLHELARRFRAIGFNRAMVATEGYTEADYADLNHLSVVGGQKLAADLAPVIREMAVELGYLP